MNPRVRQPRRPRGGAVPTVQAILEAYDSWHAQIELDSSLDIRPEYIYIDPSGQKRVVTREQLTGNGGQEGEDSWPRPGFYEIHAVDSNDVDLIEPPFRGEQTANDSMVAASGMGGGTDGIGQAVSSLLNTLARDAETAIRNKDARLTTAEKRADAVRTELYLAQDKIAILTRENANIVIAKESAERNAEIAISRQKAAESELAELKEDISGFRPHIHAGIDRFVEHAKAAMGLPANLQNEEPAPAGADTSLPPPEEWDPPPMGIEQPEQRFDELLTLIMCPTSLYQLVEGKLLDWATARALFWLRTRRTLPSWDEFVANFDEIEAGWYDDHPEQQRPEPQAQAAE